RANPAGSPPTSAMSQNARGAGPNRSRAMSASVATTSCSSFSYSARSRMKPYIMAASAGVAGLTASAWKGASVMAVSAEFLEYVLDQLELLGGVTSRRLFGGAALYQHGLIFGLVSGEAVYFRTDGSNLADYEAAGSERFDPMPDRPAK